MVKDIQDHLSHDYYHYATHCQEMTVWRWKISRVRLYKSLQNPQYRDVASSTGHWEWPGDKANRDVLHKGRFHIYLDQVVQRQLTPNSFPLNFIADTTMGHIFWNILLEQYYYNFLGKILWLSVIHCQRNIS